MLARTALSNPASALLLLRQHASVASAGATSSRRAFASSASLAREINRVTVFGAGLMGAGIAQVLAHRGKYHVTLADVTDGALQNGRSIISKSLSRIARKSMAESSDDERAKFVDSVVGAIRTTTDAAEAVAQTDLVVEAIVERLDVKQKLFAQLDGAAPDHTIFATNTSSLSVADVAKGVSDKRKERFGGFHAFNPVPQMKLIEVVRTRQTNQQVFDQLLGVAERMGKVGVSCVDSPGFIVNRLLVPYMLDAIRLADQGLASIEDIDAGMKLGAGYPMGPFELSDLVGLDTLLHIADGWRASRVSTGELPEAQVARIPLLEKMVAEGRLGQKSPKGGFYPPKGATAAKSK